MYYSICIACHHSCLTCTAIYYDIGTGLVSTCTTCNSTTNRVLVGGKCKCINSTYFDDGFSSNCILCSQVNNFTTTCTYNISSSYSKFYYSQIFQNGNSSILPLYKSLSCLTGYVIYNNLCSTCG